MNILVIGSGGREHAIVWKLVQSSRRNKLYCAPGNAGISLLAECIDVKADDLYGLLEIVRQKKIDLTIVGPEVSLALGIVNLFENYHYPIFGPTREAAEIESSKVFAKNLMKKYHIPTAEYCVFEDESAALAYLKEKPFPIVLKVDGLAGGKGVLIPQDFSQAKEVIGQVMKGKVFGDAGKRIIIEEFLIGEEISILAFTDGKNCIPMVSSQDHKKIGDGDQGLNTGGMGSYSPVPFIRNQDQKWILRNIFKPTIQALRQEGKEFKGVLYAGLILTPEGIKVLEFNARFGDPETQVILPGLKMDLVEIIHATLGGFLDKLVIEWKEQASVCVVMASGGYPDQYETGAIIHGLEELENKEDLVVFHAGTEKKGNNIVTAGGRVLGITAWAENLTKAIAKAYQGVEKINFKNQYYRKDIGEKGLSSSINNF